MTRMIKARDRKARRHLINIYERLLAEKDKQITDAEALLRQHQSEIQAVSKKRLSTIENAVEDIQAKVAIPSTNFGLIENIDASVLWLAFFWLETGVYKELTKAGLPLLYICFHIGTFYLLIRFFVRIYLVLRCKFSWKDVEAWKELVRNLHPMRLMTAVSSLVDVWVSGRFNYHMSISSTIVLSVFGSYNLYCWIMDTIKASSERFAPLRQKIRTRLDPNNINGSVIWPQQLDSPFYERPDLLLPKVEIVQKEIAQDTPIGNKMLDIYEKCMYAFEFWKVKRHLRTLIKRRKRATEQAISSQN